MHLRRLTNVLDKEINKRERTASEARESEQNYKDFEEEELPVV